jgi:hypothetical protein
MKKIIVLVVMFACSLHATGQDSFVFEKGVEKVVIPFKFINNLIFIPIKVNGIVGYHFPCF